MTTGGRKPWQKYQLETVSLFLATGCDAKEEQSIEGARSRHKVDVTVKFNKYGISCLWVVECKYWNRKVTKQIVLALKELVEDCGADRGLIISKLGFQSGAVRAATKTNITLTSIEDVKEYIKDENDYLDELHKRLMDSEKQLSEYRCPHCNSSLVSREYIEYDEDNSGQVETFECGFQTGGWRDRPCPFSPDFPVLEEFELAMSIEDQGSQPRYICDPIPKTDKARSVRLNIGYGATAREAREAVIESYNFLTTPPQEEFRGKWIQRSGQRKA